MSEAAVSPALRAASQPGAAAPSCYEVAGALQVQASAASDAAKVNASRERLLDDEVVPPPAAADLARAIPDETTAAAATVVGAIKQITAAPFQEQKNTREASELRLALAGVEQTRDAERRPASAEPQLQNIDAWASKIDAWAGPDYSS